MIAPQIGRVAGAVARRVREPAYWRSLLGRPRYVKSYGLANIREKARWFRSLALFEDGLSVWPPIRGATPEYLVAQNFLDDEFVDFTGPKVFWSIEPPMSMTDETNRLLASGEFDRFRYRYDHPDPEQRLYFPCLPDDRSAIVARLEATVHQRRPGRCCIVARYAISTVPESLQDERLAVVRALGSDMDVYGRPQYDGTNGWVGYPNYLGPVADKIGTLHRYTFTLVYENCDLPGYVTEKILDAFRAGAVPLYRGGGGLLPQVVPTGSYVDCTDRTPEEIHELIHAMSQDEVVAHRRSAIDFLSSPAADRFTGPYWSAEVTRRLRAQESERGDDPLTGPRPDPAGSLFRSWLRGRARPPSGRGSGPPGPG